MIITFYSLLGRSLISTLLSSSSEILSCFCVLGGHLCLLILEKWHYVGDILWGPAAHSTLIVRAVCSRGAPYVSCISPSLVVAPITVDVLVGGTSPQPSWLLGPTSYGGCWPRVGGAGSWNGWLAIQGILGLSLAWCWAGPGSSVTGNRAQGVPGLVLTCWWADKPLVLVG